MGYYLPQRSGVHHQKLLTWPEFYAYFVMLLTRNSGSRARVSNFLLLVNLKSHFLITGSMKSVIPVSIVLASLAEVGSTAADVVRLRTAHAYRPMLLSWTKTPV